MAETAPLDELLLRWERLQEQGQGLSVEEMCRDCPEYQEELVRRIAELQAIGNVLRSSETVHGGRSAPLDPVEIDQTISHYRILEKLGRGGMGVVYKAQDNRLGRSVALKFLPLDYARDPQRLVRFQREARTASALNHPHICTVYEMDEHDGRPFLAMELIEGQTLRVLATQRSALPAFLPVVRQVAKALAAAHGAGIVHRDIKPDNIMVRADGYAKVVDFGLARALASGASEVEASSDITDPGVLLGTVRYMSPEQAQAETVNSASDLFSLGVVLYELATGRHPFSAGSPLATLQAIRSQVPVRPSLLNPEIPVALEVLILQMLQKEACLRPTASEVDVLLAEVTGEDGRASPGRATLASQRHTVGRYKELAELRWRFETASAGQGSVLCVAGEPGIGKTTVAEDFLQELTTQGRAASIARGRCSERLAGAEAYLPFLEALHSLLHGEAGEQAARVMKVLAPSWYVQLAPLAADDFSLPSLQAEAKTASQERLKRELGAFLQEVSALRPLVLFLDDIHWADASTVDLLSYIGSKCAGLRILLVLTYRPTDLLLNKHPFVSVKRDLQARGICREITLELLSPQDIERYLALEFPEHRLPQGLASLIHAKTEGNPLFMVDLLRHLRARQVLAQEQGRWVLAQSLPNLEQELPESIRSMIERKIDQLGEEDRRLLVAASVEGYEFDSAVVCKALALDAADVEEQLEELERVHAFIRFVGEQQFPNRTPTLRYRFVHVLYQNALYATLRPTRKASLSAAIAQALLTFHGEQSGVVATQLAFLFEDARDAARAVDYFLVASQNATRIHANQEALVLACKALANAEKLEADARAARLLAIAFHRAPLYMKLSQFEEAIGDFRLAERVAEETNNVEAQINALCAMAMSFLNLGRQPEAEQHSRRALELARRAHSSAGVASAELVLACARRGQRTVPTCWGDSRVLGPPPGAARGGPERSMH